MNFLNSFVYLLRSQTERWKSVAVVFKGSSSEICNFLRAEQELYTYTKFSECTVSEHKLLS